MYRGVGPEGYRSLGDVWVGKDGPRPALDDIWTINNACLEQCQQTPQLILQDPDDHASPEVRDGVPQVYTVGVGQIGATSPDNFGGCAVAH